MARNLAGSPFDVDGSPKVTIEIGPLGDDPAGPQPESGQTGRLAGMKSFENVEEYCYVSDVLTLGDQFSLTLSNIDGDYSGKIAIGDTVKLYVADPNVQAGARVLKLQGIITQRLLEDTVQGGCRIQITGADLGWHLANNTGPIFQRYRGKSINRILEDVLDPSWNLKGVRQGNEFNAAAKLGRAGIKPPGAQTAYPPLPPLQWEPGMMIADLLIQLAKFQKLLLNVSADGYVQFFQPNYRSPVQYVFHHHKATENNRVNNNVKEARLTESIDGVFTKVTCVGQVAYFQFADARPNALHPNEGRIRADYNAPNALPFKRFGSFGDSEQMDKDAVANRAQWMWQRGQFDSWEYQVTVKGHSQLMPESTTAFFYEPDTMCEINDTVFGIKGNFYVSACQYRRTMSGGTETALRIRKPNVLGA